MEATIKKSGLDGIRLSGIINDEEAGTVVARYCLHLYNLEIQGQVVGNTVEVFIYRIKF